MSRFSPAYKRDDPFTLADGVQGAAQALTRYTLGKRQMGRQDAADERTQQMHDRVFDRDDVLDERYENREEYDRGNRAADRYYDRGEVEGVNNIPPSGPVTDYGPAEGTAADALGGGVAEMPTLQGEATTLGQALEQSIVSDELKPMGSGIPGDYNSQAFQVDGGIPVPGVPGRFLMPQSGKQMQLEGEIARLAEMLEGSESRTGFAGEAGSEGRANESRIQARTRVEGPYAGQNRKRQSEGRVGGGRGGLTAGQDLGNIRNQSEVIYAQAIRNGADEYEALDAAIEATGVAPDAGFMQSVMNARRGQVKQHRAEYGSEFPATGILGVVEQMLLAGDSEEEVLEKLIGETGIGQHPGPYTVEPTSTTATDSIMPYLNREWIGQNEGGAVARRQRERGLK